MLFNLQKVASLCLSTDDLFSYGHSLFSLSGQHTPNQITSVDLNLCISETSEWRIFLEFAQKRVLLIICILYLEFHAFFICYAQRHPQCCQSILIYGYISATNRTLTCCSDSVFGYSFIQNCFKLGYHLLPCSNSSSFPLMWGCSYH